MLKIVVKIFWTSQALPPKDKEVIYACLGKIIQTAHRLTINDYKDILGSLTLVSLHKICKNICKKSGYIRIKCGIFSK